MVVTITGRLDTLTAPAFDSQMKQALAEPRPRILIDASGVSYISSAGLRSIQQLMKHAEAHGGRVGLFAVPPPIMQVLGISGFPALLDIFPDRAAALGA